MYILDIAKQAYDAYALTTDNKNFVGLEMRKFEDLPMKTRQAWCSACTTVLHMAKQFVYGEAVDLQGLTVTVLTDSLRDSQDKPKKAADSFKKLADSFKDFVEILSDRVNDLGKEITKETNTQNRSFAEGLKEAYLSDLSEIKYILRSATNTNADMKETALFDVPTIINKGALEGELTDVRDRTIEVGDKVKLIKDLPDSGLVKLSYMKDAYKPLEIGDIGYVDSASYTDTDGYITIAFTGCCGVSMRITQWKEFLEIIL